LSFVSELDAGDSYNFSPPPNQHRVVQTKYSLISCRALAETQELVLAITLTAPQSLSSDRAGRSDDTVANTGLLRIRLFADEADETNIDFSLDWTNRASDQRTRLILALPAPVEHTFSDSGFEWVRHPVKYADYPTAVTRQEMPVVVNPSLSTIVAGELVFLHRAMHEYEVLRVNGEQMLGVTLIRGVGWMSRRDLVTRGVGAGPDMATPEAQCLGTELFEFQIAIGDTGVHPLTAAQRFRRPLVCLRGTTTRWADGFEIDNQALQVSAVRRIGDSIELRLWNPTDVDQSFALSTGQWQRVAADGKQGAGTTTLVKPHEIVTLRCRR
jgi:alpha-mannosidase